MVVTVVTVAPWRKHRETESCLFLWTVTWYCVKIDERVVENL